MSSPTLSVQKVTKRFDGLTALDRVNLAVGEQELKGLIGPNGAGKTTLFNVMTGVLLPDEGEVFFEGDNITGLRTYDIADRGLIRTFQEAKIFPEMTVLKNTLMGGYRQFRTNLVQTVLRLPSFRREERTAREKAYQQLERVQLKEVAHRKAEDLTAGQERLLQLARALMGDPALLCLDEPAAGLNARETELLGDVIRSINQTRELPILLIEHDMSLVMEVCETVTVLNHGEVIADAVPRELQSNEAVLEAYLGADI